MHTFKLYLEFIKIRIVSHIEYRKMFLFWFFAQWIAYGVQLLLIWVMVHRFQDIQGWKPFEVVLLYALSLNSYALAGFFFYNPCTQLSHLVRTGEFDEILTRPLNPFLYLVSREFNFGYITHVVLAVPVTVVSFVMLDIPFTFTNILMLLLILIGGALIQGAVFLFTSVPAFWIVDSNGMQNVLFQFRDFANYPLSIYHKSIQILLTFVIPFAFINFYPAQFFLGKQDFSVFHPAFQFMTPLVGLVMFALALWFWHFGINRYKSTGS
ncbi:ABC transporter permease [Cohnella pontilimi]|uniref:ABC transporter permease n=1 Tax=Cohnella pontilimi TaxID=2564100 RepID=A0A4U0F8N2_9BACL|nr:ABC-2 family transporter protein [Cohnella pontilimi]TJY41096.1 ABC transporter permease [Cohnella pontilimi]